MTEGLDLGKSRAILMGTWDYDHFDPRSLPAVERSFRRMRGLLTGPHCGGWPEASIVELENRRDPYRARIDLIGACLSAEDVLLFYYVGHGLYDDRLQLGLTVGESSREHGYVGATTLGFEAVREAFDHSEAKVKVAILDCCYAGLASPRGGRLSSDDTPPIGSYLIMSSSDFEESWYQQECEAPQTYFTKCFVDAVETGIEGAPPDLRLGHLFNAVSAKLVEHRKPAPKRQIWNRASDWVFARNNAIPDLPAAAPSPAENYERALHLERRGRVEDLREIEELYLSAARANHVAAMAKAGMVLEGRVRAEMRGTAFSRAGEADLAKATRWYTAAAKAGDGAAALLLGELNEERFQDTERALDWYDLGVRLGNSLAAERRSSLERRRELGIDQVRAEPDADRPTARPRPRSLGEAAMGLHWLGQWQGQGALAMAECLDALVNACGGEWSVLSPGQQQTALGAFMDERPERSRLALAAVEFYEQIGAGRLREFTEPNEEMT